MIPVSNPYKLIWNRSICVYTFIINMYYYIISLLCQGEPWCSIAAEGRCNSHQFSICLWQPGRPHTAHPALSLSPTVWCGPGWAQCPSALQHKTVQWTTNLTWHSPIITWKMYTKRMLVDRTGKTCHLLLWIAELPKGTIRLPHLKKNQTGPHIG